MFSSLSQHKITRTGSFGPGFLPWMLVLGLLAGVSLSAAAQAAGQSNDSQTQTTPAAGAGTQNPNQQEAPPEAGGPNSDTGPYAIPKKGEEAPPPPPPERPKKIEGMPDYSIHVDVPEVTVPVSVTTKDGQFISNLKKENFRIYEDGTQQSIHDFKIEEAPVTAVLLVEFALTNYDLELQALQASYIFASILKKDDWVAMVSYDMKPNMLLDFTQDKNAVQEALRSLHTPSFSETWEFSALYDTLDRLERVEGHKYIILVSTGVDTGLRLTFDQILKKVKSSHDITIIPVSIGWLVRERAETHGTTGISHGMSSLGMSPIDYVQADNEMQTFGKLTGGRFYQPRLDGDFVDVFKDIAENIRNQYTIVYHPTNTKLDGTYRKLKVDVVAPDGGPLKVKDQKGKDVKYQINAREGYTAKHTVD